MEEDYPDTMRKGQITLFIILGLVLVITVVLLIMLRQTLIPEPQTEVTEDEALTRSCLVRVTEASLGALRNDSMIRMEEGGPMPLPFPQYSYVRYKSKEYLDETYDETYVMTDIYGVEHVIGLPMGIPEYTGLCSLTGSNAINLFRPQRFSCNSRVYHLRQEPEHSIQTQLELSITNQMHNCLAEGMGLTDPDQYVLEVTTPGALTGQATGMSTAIAGSLGRAEVIIQNQGIIVRWSNPQIQHSPREPLHVVWKTIRETISKETTVPSFSPNREYCGEFPDREHDCTDCYPTVGFRQLNASDHEGLYPPKTGFFPYNVWEYSVAGEPVARILLENRNISVKKEIQVEIGGDVVNVEFYNDTRHHEDVCDPFEGPFETDIYHSGELRDDAEDLQACRYQPLYTFDDDVLTRRIITDIDEIPVNSWWWEDHFVAPPEARCGYDLRQLAQDNNEIIAWHLYPPGAQSRIQNIGVPCSPILGEYVKPRSVCTNGGELYEPHINNLQFSRGCFAVNMTHEPNEAIHLNVTDMATNWMLLNITELPAASPVVVNTTVQSDVPSCDCRANSQGCRDALAASDQENPLFWNDWPPPPPSQNNQVCMNGYLLETRELATLDCTCLSGTCPGASP